MRRLAKTFRNHNYSSQKDYQSLIEEYCDSFTFDVINDSNHITLISNTLSKSGILGFGGFIYSDSETPITFSIISNETIIHSETKSLKNTWNRIGHAWECEDDDLDIFVKIEFEKSTTISLWGFNIDVIDINNIKALESFDTELILQSINKPHLKPETYYINHDINMSMDIDLDSSSSFKVTTESIPIELKKCPYCQRVLPISRVHVDYSSFHNHKSKLTGFQNECRSCKKWDINDYFNPDRSTDKLNESSIITRERKILLKEPDKILELKDRQTGEGLKSMVWKKFSKKCFNCNTPLKLKEVQLDHTRPLAYLWPIDEYATCLCSNCNNSKHDSFPIDFYSDDKLKKLSEITGLDYDDLIKKDVNLAELQRIIDNIVYFSENLDERTFKSIANKVLSVRSEINLFNILKSIDEKAYDSLITRLKKRKD